MIDEKILEEFTKDVGIVAGSAKAFLEKYALEEKYAKLYPHVGTNEWVCIIHNLMASANMFLASTVLFEGTINIQSLFKEVGYGKDKDVRL